MTATNAETVYTAALAAPALTLDGVPAIVTGIKDGNFLVITTARPVLGHIHASGEWHYRAAARILSRGGDFKS